MPTVLVIDADSILVTALGRLLRTRNVTVEGVSSAELALDRIKTPPPPDLVVSEYRLPGTSGIDLLMRLPLLLPNAGRIMYTADHMAADLLADAPFPVLVKPVPAAVLTSLVLRLLARDDMPAPW